VIASRRAREGEAKAFLVRQTATREGGGVSFDVWQMFGNQLGRVFPHVRSLQPLFRFNSKEIGRAAMRGGATEAVGKSEREARNSLNLGLPLRVVEISSISTWS
jgi:hypothetical protein